jgi:hypothetical protein
VIGVRFNDGDAVYEVVAADGGAWIVNRLDAFESPRHMTAAEIAAAFKAEVADAPAEQPSERDGWEALARQNDRAAVRLAHAEQPEDFEPEEGTPEHDAWRRLVRAAKAERRPTPEDHFQRVSDADARRIQPRARERA